MNDRAEWLEIIQPQTNELMYANLKTGECSWDPPDCLNVRRINDQTTQWWELFDKKSSRFYYYNVNTLETRWQKPRDKAVIIVPLAKFQISKTETSSSSDQFKRDVSTQTSSSLSYCSNAATQTTPPTLPRFGHYPEHLNKNNQSEHSQNHPQMDQRSLKHYLLNEQARFLDHCKKVGDSYWHPSDEDFDGEEYEESFDGSSTDDWDADDEDNDNDNEDECDEESGEDVLVTIPKLGNDETDASDYYETSSFVFCRESMSFMSDRSSADTNERTIMESRNSIKSPDTWEEPFKSKEKVPVKPDKVLEETRSEIDGKKKERKSDIIEIKDDEVKPIPPKRVVSLDSSKIHTKQRASTEQLEKYARENIKRHLKKGGLNQVLKRRHSLKGMLIWTKSSIKQPMIATLMNDNNLKLEAINCFKLIQQYCGDRGKGTGKSPSTGGTLVQKEEVAKELITKGVVKGLLLRDEIFVQLCRQTTDNPLEESLQLGLELIALCLYYFAPSQKFAPYLSSFLSNHKSDFAREVCLKKLQIKMESSSSSGSSGGHCRRPTSAQELAMVTVSLKRGFLGIFGESLPNLMAFQSKYLPKRKLPWIQVTLSETILRLGGAEQEGIFRIAGDVEETAMLKLYIDCVRMDKELDTDFIALCNRWKAISGDVNEASLDVNVFACLLKQWFRELKDPVIPYSLYYEALSTCESPVNAVNLVERKLPAINKLVIGYLIRFLQVFSAKQNVENTKMDENNLSMIWSPNVLRPPPDGQNAQNPSVIFENTRKEMTFIRTLIQFLDTSYIHGIL
ncbi:myTH4 and RhoGAP_KIAA1688 domain-containing protein RhoGAP93B isoform X2 [Brevipalpus obovatus]|uniref:myTH4 and RhoGAP_KIAA1688 domain-containing protein RhoGAP93B isoform X2 n=1 Tax=Brevipalpus obovatus TaxID=246614 RepID=UPI003D9E6D94